jgi:predicted anti-sigma-YlaC factor YlaD
MKVVYYLTYVMAFVFLAGETARRGIGYFAINATTMIEDYLCGVLMLWAAWLWFKKSAQAYLIMAVAWAYATGGMFVPFAAHLEAWLRNETFRPDHPHTDIGSIVLKGVIWAVCLVCLVVTLANHDTERSTRSA